jgi:hypothetical protein
MFLDHDRSQFRRRLVTRATRTVVALTLIAAAACDQEPTSPVPSLKLPGLKPVSTVSPGALAVYKDRAAWLAAVTAEGATAQEYNFTGLTPGRITSRSVDYGPFRIAVDYLSSNSFNNPGIDVISDAGCSLGTGDCNRMIFNMIDPAFFQTTAPFDMPRVDSLVMPQPVIAWGATFSQTGYAVGCGTCPSVTGPVTMTLGSATFVLNDSLGTNGFGFIGIIAGTPSNVITFTYTKAATSTWVNDLIEVYRPEFANAPAPPPDPVPQMISDLRAYAAGAGLPKAIAKKIDQDLEQALAAFTANQISTACGELQNVISLIQSNSAKRIDAAVRAEIVSQSSAIRSEIGC